MPAVNAEVQELIKVIRRNGFQVDLTSGSSGKVLFKGEQVFKHEQDGGTPVTIHLTPGDSRWKKNLMPILIRAKVLERDPFSNYTPPKTPPTYSPENFVAMQVIPWVQRRLDEGFSKSELAREILKRWPKVSTSENSLAVQMTQMMNGKTKRLREVGYKGWKEVIDGWSKNPATPASAKAAHAAGTNGDRQQPEPQPEVVELHTPETVAKERKKKPVRPSIPLSARLLAMSMDARPDKDEALLLHMELVEVETYLYA